MKKLIIYPLITLFSLLMISVMVVAGILFFSPTTIINPRSINWVLEKSEVLKSWSWADANLSHEWNKWNDRDTRGFFKDFCFEYESEGLDVSTCLKDISWDLNITFSLTDGFQFSSRKPLTVRSDLLKVVIKDTPADPPEESGGPPDVQGYWDILWGKMIPDMDIKVEKIIVMLPTDEHEFDFRLTKSAEKLNIWSSLFQVVADPENLEVIGPEVYKLPIEKNAPIPLELRNFRFTARMKKDSIPMQVTGAIEPLHFDIESTLDLPLQGGLDSLKLRKSFLQKLHGELRITDIENSVRKYGPPKYKTLPAPLNVMNGDIVSRISTQDGSAKEEIIIEALTSIDLKGTKQVLRMIIGTAVPLNVMEFAPGAVTLSVNFEEVTLLLPRITKTTSPPQFRADPRFSKKKEDPAPEAEEEGIELDLHLQALENEALHLKSNLLDEALRLNFDIKIEKGNLHSGFLRVLPLETKVFKRPIHVKDMLLTFRHPRDPVIEGTIRIPLPEYKITMKIEGPLDNPEVAFSSDPPLPQSDIYAVLLFGRPMSELAPEDKNSAQSIDRVLSQGILSLSVLYFLAGSPVEYVGYDPGSSQATAQIGLGRRSSLRVGAGSGGLNSTGVRHSLGGGWYVDTSVKKTQGLSEDSSRNYGVMLERVIAY